MHRHTTGWIVRTEKDGRHRYWTVGIAGAAAATAIAATAAGSDTARAAARLGTFDTAQYVPTEGVAVKFEWDSRPVSFGAKTFKIEPSAVSCKTILGELTFDIVVAESGVTHVEGCYRLSGGNWQVYYLTNHHTSGPPLDIPFIESKAIFSSDITGIVGYFPPDFVLNKKSIGRILADAVGVDGWVEMIGPDSLLLK